MRVRDLAVACGVALMLAVVGCDKKKSGSSSSNANEKTDELYVGRSVSEFVADKSLPDAAVIKAYVRRRPGAPTLFPVGKSEWATVEPFKGAGGGYLLWIERLDHVTVATFRGADFDPLQAERDGVKSAAEFCRDTLKDLQQRNLRGIGYKYVGEAKTSADGKHEYMTTFRVSVMSEDLAKLANANGPATAGSVFDPRSQRIKEIFMVDENMYPQIEYRKKTK